MKIIKQSYKITRFNPEIDVYDICDGYCTCYHSKMPPTFEAQCEFIRKHREHESPLEHSRLSVKFFINRGISHELVRHRLASFSQESTRWCNYSKDRFGNELTFTDDETIKEFFSTNDLLETIEQKYIDMLAAGFKAEQARAILPNNLKTTLLVTANFREWRHIFAERCTKRAHYQMREVMIPLFREVNSVLPCVFDDLEEYIA